VPTGKAAVRQHPNDPVRVWHTRVNSAKRGVHLHMAPEWAQLRKPQFLRTVRRLL